MVWLCISCAAQCTFSLAQPALTGIGRPYLSAIALVFAVVLKILFGILLFDGSLASFGMAIALADLLTAMPYVYLLRTYLGLSLGDIAQSLMRTTVVAAAVLTVTFICRNFLVPANWHVAPTVIVCVMIAAPIWYLAVRLTKHPLTKELALLQDELRKRLVRN
jgi:O-antigen/teichoic acid export membrane protein